MANFRAKYLLVKFMSTTYLYLVNTVTQQLTAHIAENHRTKQANGKKQQPPFPLHPTHFV